MNRLISLLFAFLIFSSTAFAQLNVRVMHYNLLQFGNSCGGVSISEKYDWLGTVLEHYRPHIFTVNELSPNIAYVNGIKALSFDYTNVIENAKITNNAGGSLVNEIFYDKEIFTLKADEDEVIGGSVRDINVYHLYVNETAANNDTTFIDLIVTHMKAGTSSNDVNQRQNSAVSIMNYINSHPDRNVLVMGDFNIYSNNEAAFQTMVFNNNTDIAFRDPSGKQNGWAGSSNAIAHTQSTRTTSPDCGSTGGMDDRFDMILASKEIMGDSLGISYVPDSYRAFGNGGNSYNTELNCSGNNTVPLAVCIALKQLSDHLPVVLELQLSGVTSLEESLQIAGVELFKLPHSTDQSIELRLEMEEFKPENLTLEVWNITGQKLSQQTVSHQSQTIQLPFSNQANGSYLIRLIDKQGKQKLLRL